MLHHGPNSIIHRDIKPENILVMPDDSLPSPWTKLADFGIAIEGTQCEGRVGTWLYTAAEVFSTGEQYTSKIDVWSLGVVLLQLMICGCIPEPENGVMQGPQWCRQLARFATESFDLSRNHDRYTLRLPEETWSWESHLWRFAKVMLTMDPRIRPSSDVCHHRAFQMYSVARECGMILIGGKPSNNIQQHPGTISSDSKVDAYVERHFGQLDRKQVLNPKVSSPHLKSSDRPGSAPGYMTTASSISSFSSEPMASFRTAPTAFGTGVEVAEALQDLNCRSHKTAQIDNPQPVGFGLVHGHYNDDDNDAPEPQEQKSAKQKAKSHNTPSERSFSSQNHPKTHRGGPSSSKAPVPTPRRKPSEVKEARAPTKADMKRAGSPSPSASGSNRRRKSSASARAAEKSPASYYDEAGGGRKKDSHRQR